MFKKVKIQSKLVLKMLFSLVFFLGLFCQNYAQQTDTVRLELEIGKRNNFILNRQISFYNVGRYSSVFAKIFFKESKYDSYKSIGFLGRKIKPYLQNNPIAFHEFKRYRNYKIVSYISLISVPFVAIAWLASAGRNNRISITRRRGIINVFPTDAYYAFPISIVGLCAGSILFNQQAEHHLLIAIQLANHKMKPMKSKFHQ